MKYGKKFVQNYNGNLLKLFNYGFIENHINFIDLYD